MANKVVTINLNSKAMQSRFADVVGVSQQAISKQIEKGFLKKDQTYRIWFKSYCENLRTQAAGRGGDEQQTLTKARTEESEIKAAKLRLEFHRDIGSVISTEDAASVISLWCRQANIDYMQGFHKLVSEIQSRYKIKIDNEMVEDIVRPTTERIKSHADKLGESLIEGVDDISETKSSGNG